MTDESRPKQSNEDRKADAIRRRIDKAHAWRVNVWANRELAILSMQAELTTLGYPEVDLFAPDFTDENLLREYAATQPGK